MMNPFMSYTQSFNESMTKDDREDAERRMATARPINAGIASPAAIAQSKMTKDDREDAERRMSMQATLTSRQIVPSAKLSADAPVAQSPYPSTGYGGPSGSGYVQPTAKPINAGIASPAAIQASQSGDAIQETQDAIAAAFKALSVSRSQGTVNVGSFNFARRELLNAKDALAVAKSRATPGEQVLMSQLEEQVDTIQGEVNIQLRYLQTSAAKSNMTKDDREDAERRMATLAPVTAGIVSTAAIAQSNKSKEDREISNAYKTPGYVQPVYASQVRQSTPTGMTRMTTSPVIIPGTKDAREAVAGTDWAKLALQIGAAYLLLA